MHGLAAMAALQILQLFELYLGTWRLRPWRSLRGWRVWTWRLWSRRLRRGWLWRGWLWRWVLQQLLSHLGSWLRLLLAVRLMQHIWLRYQGAGALVLVLAL